MKKIIISLQTAKGLHSITVALFKILPVSHLWSEVKFKNNFFPEKEEKL